MAYETKDTRVGTVLAGANLTAKQFRFVNIDSAGEWDIASAGGPAPGVLQNNPADGQVAEVECGPGRVVMTICDGNVTRGAYVAVGATGGAVDVTTTKYRVGIALSAGVAGDIIPVLFGFQGIEP